MTGYACGCLVSVGWAVESLVESARGLLLEKRDSSRREYGANANG